MRRDGSIDDPMSMTDPKNFLTGFRLAEVLMPRWLDEDDPELILEMVLWFVVDIASTFS